MGNSIFVIGGFNIRTDNFYSWGSAASDVWCSSDLGSSWIQLTPSPGFKARGLFAAVVAGVPVQSIFVTGGLDSNGNAFK